MQWLFNICFLPFSFRNRGGFFRDNFRRSPDRSRGRNARNNRRSRSKSFDRFRNRRNNRSVSRDHSRSRSVGRPWKKGPMSPLSPSQTDAQSQMPQNNANFAMVAPTYVEPNVYNNFPPQSNMGGYMSNQAFPNYDYSVPMMQPPPTAFTSYPPPNIMQPIAPSDDFQQQQQQQQQSQWASAPPPPIINLPPEPALTETGEEKQKREGKSARCNLWNFCGFVFTICFWIIDLFGPKMWRCFHVSIFWCWKSTISINWLTNFVPHSGCCARKEESTGNISQATWRLCASCIRSQARIENIERTTWRIGIGQSAAQSHNKWIFEGKRSSAGKCDN